MSCGVRKSHLIVPDDRPVAVTGAATPSQDHRISLDRRLQRDASQRTAVGALLGNPQSNRSVRTHTQLTDRLPAFAPLRFMRLEVTAAFGIKRLAFWTERGRYSIPKTLRFSQQVVEVPQTLSEQRRFDLIHGDQDTLNAIITPGTAVER